MLHQSRSEHNPSLNHHYQHHNHRTISLIRNKKFTQKNQNRYTFSNRVLGGLHLLLRRNNLSKLLQSSSNLNIKRRRRRRRRDTLNQLDFGNQQIVSMQMQPSRLRIDIVIPASPVRLNSNYNNNHH